jgi:hypothetical protein
MNPEPTPLEVALSAQKPIADAPRQPLALDLLLTEDERRTVTIDFHHQFKDFISRPARTFDEVDELVAELRATQPEGLDQ